MILKVEELIEHSSYILSETNENLVQTFNIVSSAEWVENDPCHTYISIFVQNKRKSAQYIYSGLCKTDVLPTRANRSHV